jgi:hypothetical protein
MANQRYIKTIFWDKKYIRSLDAKGKLLYLYLFSGPLAVLCGAYEITIARMVWDTGLTEIEVDAWLQKFVADGKVEFRDDWIVVFNTIEHQSNKTPTIRTAIIEQVKCCPDWIKHSLSIRYEWLSHLNLNLNSNLNSKNGVPPVAADAAAGADPWQQGIEILKHSGKMTEAQARPFLGRLAKQYSQPLLAEAIAATYAEKPVDPRAFLIGVLQERSGDNMRAKSSVGRDDGVERAVELVPCAKCQSEFCLGGQACNDRASKLAGPSQA